MPDNRKARDDLAKQLQLLVDGELTNDDFDEMYYGRWERSADAGVRVIGTFGYSLYSSDLPLAYTLTGRYTIAEETRDVTDRALLFLATDLDYAWPGNFFRVDYGWICGFFIVSLSTGLVFTAALHAFGGLHFPWDVVAVLLAAWDVLFAALWFANRAGRSKHEKQLRKVGDPEVWPFVDRAEHAAAHDHALHKTSGRATQPLDDCR